MTDTTELAGLLREVRDQQREQIAMQTQALALQREHFELARAQLTRAERINDRAEAIQARAQRASRVIVWLCLPLIAGVVALLFWSQLRELLAR